MAVVNAEPQIPAGPGKPGPPRHDVLGRIAPLVGAGAFLAALWVLKNRLGGQSFGAIQASLAALSTTGLLLSLLLTAANFLVLIGYDLLALRDLGRPLRWGTVATTATVANALGHNFGNTLLTGAAVRYWRYTAAGLPASAVTRITVFCSLGFWLGYLLLAGVLLTAYPMRWPAGWRWAGHSSAVLGVAFLGLLLAWCLLVAAFHGRALRWHAQLLRVPQLGTSAAQLLTGTLDVALMVSVFHVLLPAGVPWKDTATAVLVAVVAANLSLVPGGLGVFESVVVLLLSPEVAPAPLAAALLAYRIVYFLAPLVVAMVLVGLPRTRRVASRRVLAMLGPDLLATVVFLAGAQLLLSGALPAASGRLEAAQRLMSLPVIELSHFLASVAGAALLLLAHALQRRLDGAWHLALMLLLVSAVLSLGRSWDYEQAIVLGAAAALLLAARRQFRRKSSLLAQPFSPGWFAAAMAVVLATGWLLLLTHSHAAVSEQPWWSFALHAETARGLRASVGAAVILALAGLHFLLRPAPPPLALPGPRELELARAIADRSSATYAQLVLRGDKAVMFDEARESFLMYGRSGRSWVSMGDPVGTPAGTRELRIRFRDLCDRYDGWCVFFEVREERRADYAELGLRLTPLGQQARVAVERFTLATPVLRSVRHAHAHALRSGCSFELVPAAEVAALVPELAEVSAAWLARKPTREKGFSSASFDGGYLVRFPLALVRHQGRIVAFANVWLGAGQEEFSIDLMRHRPDAPHGTMDFLFSELLLWGRQQGWRWFDFGMAPLAGLERHRDAPVWRHIAPLLYRHGEHFYRFAGLRSFKAKFDPVWTPLYLASPGGVALPVILVDVTALIAGSLRGILG